VAEWVGQEVLAEVDLRIRQGSDCGFTLVYSEDSGDGPVEQDYTGWSARSQIRAKVGGEVWLDVGQYLTLTPGDASLTIDGLIPAAVTEDPAWNARASKARDGEVAPAGVWDVELVTATGAVIPLAAGRVFVDPDVTREA
jgi:hypothetical protein